jgi:hypothetical protein
MTSLENDTLLFPAPALAPAPIEGKESSSLEHSLVEQEFTAGLRVRL